MTATHRATPRATPGRRLAGGLRRVITAWALVGGCLLLGIVAVNVLAVASGVAGHRITGDFEITEMLVAVAVFCFLPYCQMTDANVTADIFTARASPRMIAVLRLAASVVALAFAALLLWRMGLGMGDQRRFGYRTTILQIPIWWAFVPILVSLALLVAASALTLIESGRRMARPEEARDAR